MPSFKWLKIKEGETKGNPQKFQKLPIISGLFIKKKHYICLLVNARNILEWPVLSVNLLLRNALKYSFNIVFYLRNNFLKVFTLFSISETTSKTVHSFSKVCQCAEVLLYDIY